MDALPEAATAEHLTEALRRSGSLDRGRVTAVAMESARNTILSRIVRLRLSYDDAADAAPRSLILKTALKDRAVDRSSAGRHEVAFYTEVAAARPQHLIRCHEARADPHGWHLLLEDLTDSHFIATTWPLPPSFDQCGTIMRARARFHAAWWDDPRLGAGIGRWLDAAAIGASLERAGNAVERFIERTGDLLPDARRDLFRRLLAAMPGLYQRYQSRRDITIGHGDAHLWNCFLPRDGGDDVRFFDWDNWRVGVGTGDLAYMMAMHWYPDRRGAMETPLLDVYHTTLAEQRVSYDRRALDEDYRRSVLMLMLTPVWQEADGIPPLIWWNNLERVLLAVDDLGCRDLLG